MPAILLLFVVLAASATPAVAQSVAVADDFADGDFTTAPVWRGDAAFWTTAPTEAGFALTAAGPEASDTLHLATASPVAHGSWSAALRTWGGRLSNYNLVRLYVIADTSALEGPVTGYHIQFGTNRRDVRLYRSDPTAPDGRLLLASSAPDLLAADSLHLDLTVERTRAGAWTVRLGDDAVLHHEEADPDPRPSRYLGLWVKHSSRRAQHVALEAIAAYPAPPVVDRTPPQLLAAAALDSLHLEVAFDEPVDGCATARYGLAPGPAAPAQMLDCAPGSLASTFRMRLSRPLETGTYTLTATATPDEAGNLLADGRAPFRYTAPIIAVPAPGDVVINELHVAPEDGDSEFVEILNRSTHTFDLGRFTIRDERSEPIPLAASPTPLAPGAFFVAAADTLALRWSHPAAGADALAAWPTLNNSGDRIELRFDGRPVDAVAYAGSQVDAGRSLERIDPALPSWSAATFAPSQAPRGATPGAPNSIYAPDTDAPRLLGAEQIGRRAVRLHVSEAIAPASLRADRFGLEGQAPAAVEVSDAAHSIDLYFAQPITGYALHVAPLHDLVGYASDAGTLPVARWPEPGELALSEILFAPRADRYDGLPDQPEYLELVSRAAHPLALGGLHRVGLADETGRADTLHLAAPGAILQPGQFAIVFAAEAEAPNAISESFPAAAGAPYLPLPVGRSSLSLRNQGDRVALLRADGLMLETATYSPDWHHPSLHTTTGLALERISLDVSAEEPTNWTTSTDPEGGTPGRANSQAAAASRASPAEPGVTAQPAPFSPDGDGHDDVAVLSYHLPQATALVRARIFDVRGRLVRLLEPGRLSGPSGQLLWDGTDDAGHTARMGPYVVLVEATDPSTGAAEAYKLVVVLARRLGDA